MSWVRSQFEKDPTITGQSKEQQVLEFIRFELAPQEGEVYDYLLGLEGKPRIQSTGKIAKKLGITEFKVSRIKKSIATKIDKHLR